MYCIFRCTVCTEPIIYRCTVCTESVISHLVSVGLAEDLGLADGELLVIGVHHGGGGPAHAEEADAPGDSCDSLHDSLVTAYLVLAASWVAISHATASDG